MFLQRPNRFIARVLLHGKEETVHVKNTGRCRELLVPGAKVYLEQSQNPARKTKWDLIAVFKGNRLINMDSQLPNRVAEEWLIQGGLGDFDQVLREQTWGASRLDFCLKRPGRTKYVEVKGVTLEEEGKVYFPDAPTVRGLRHLEELASAVAMGWTAEVLFVVQMGRARFMAPNDETQPQFGETLRRIRKEGVALSARLCRVAPDEIILGEEIPIQL